MTMFKDFIMTLMTYPESAFLLGVSVGCIVTTIINITIIERKF